MEFGSSSNSYSNRERLISEEDEMIGIDYEMGNIVSNTGSNQAVKLHFSTTYASNSSSSPSSASSHHHHYTTQTQQLLPLTTHHQNYNKQQQPQMGSWLLGKTTTTTTAAELEDVSNEEETAAPTKGQAIIMQETKDIIEEGEAEEDRVLISLEKEHMFDKVVTPSDVGKLNRLVIPKQHAEKYFPLDSSSNEKGLLLNFEDRNGKPWRFRYSYWNSSQSYVMTKGWSRFVKDKKLDAGDVVSFHRGVGDLAKGRLFIDWRRRSHPPAAAAAAAASFSRHLPFYRSIPWNPLLMMRPPVLPASMYSQSQIDNNFYNRNSISLGGTGNDNNVLSPRTLGSILYLRSQLPAAPATQQPPPPPPHTEIGMTKWQQHPIVFDSVPVVQGKATAKRLRLFGVNMDCPITESDDECHILSSSTSIQHATMAIHDQPSQLSSSSQLSLYDATPLLPPFDFLNKGKASMSFD